MSVHLHRDYLTAWCGEDASHILMTYERRKATCKACKTAKREHDAAEAKASSEHRAVERENSRHHAKARKAIADALKRRQQRGLA